MKKFNLFFSAIAIISFMMVGGAFGKGGPPSDTPGGPPSDLPSGRPNGQGGQPSDVPADRGWGHICNNLLAEGCVLKGAPLPTGEWTEQLASNGEECTGGEPGNTLNAFGGKIWSFSGAYIETVDPAWDLSTSPPAPLSWLTRYIEGTFELSIPCLDDTLVAEDVIAYNYTLKTDELLGFMIYFSGVFTDIEPNIAFEAVGHYSGIPYVTDDCLMGDNLDSVTLVLTPVLE